MSGAEDISLCRYNDGDDNNDSRVHLHGRDR